MKKLLLLLFAAFGLIALAPQPARADVAFGITIGGPACYDPYPVYYDPYYRPSSYYYYRPYRSYRLYYHPYHYGYWHRGYWHRDRGWHHRHPY